jgi:hypothetical protein
MRSKASNSRFRSEEKLKCKRISTESRRRRIKFFFNYEEFDYFKKRQIEENTYYNMDAESHPMSKNGSLSMASLIATK